jgi:hypothetical protein
MRSVIISIFTLLLSAVSVNNQDISTHTLTIIVTDEAGNPLIGAQVSVYDADRLLSSGTTDVYGRYSLESELSVVKIQVSYTGYRTEVIKEVEINDNTITIELQSSTSLEEIFISGMKTKRNKTMGISIASEAYSSPSFMPSDSKVASGSPLRGYTSDQSLPGSGQITAGEWNDLHNWNDWKKLINGEQYKSMNETWTIYTNNRYTVLVLNENDIPIPGAKVEMLDRKGQLLWQSYSDVSGRAELFKDAYRNETEAYQFRVSYQGQSEVIRQIKHAERGAMIAYLDVPCPSRLSVDISWVVDATSSMSDEIKYLQSELLNVIDRVKSADADIRWSSIFYRDAEDEYVTRMEPFSSEPQNVLDFIRNQEARGGGDFPEAVSDAVHEMTTMLKWRPESTVKLCFLLLDAPPHQDKFSMETYRKAVKAAAAKGIKIIPITASGINRETEFLMKFTSILTNGTYVFITDDSGIGNPHLDPVVEDYEVEKLNDLLVRLIDSYTSLSQCTSDVLSQRSKDIRFYPNPASDMVNIENLLPGDQVLLISTSGKIVMTSKVEGNATHQVDIQNLVSGNYLLRIKGEDRTEDFRLLIIT